MNVSEQKKLKALARQYGNKGFDVFTDLAGFKSPPSYGGFTPDLVAKKGDQVILVEVVQNSRDATRKDDEVAQFARYASEQPNVRFDLVVVRPDTAKQISPRAILRHLRGRTLKELEVTSELLPEAFVVLYAIAVEDLLISAAAKKEVEIGRFKDLPDLALHLQQKGVITPTIVEFANDAWESRNRVLHNHQRDLFKLDPQEKLARFKRLLDDYGWVYDKG
jgi:hypothetical protein